MMEEVIKLPRPAMSDVVFERAVKERMSYRHFKPESISLDSLAQLLWAAQGTIGRDSVGRLRRTVPSAAMFFPLEVYVVVGQPMESLDPGLYHYRAEEHTLEFLFADDLRSQLQLLCFGQISILEAPLSIVVVADITRFPDTYGERREKFALIEAGHVGQNIYLQATTIGLITSIVGTFEEEELSVLLQLPPNQKVVEIFPVGQP